MVYDVKTPMEYMASLDDDWRRTKLDSLRSMIKSQAPDLKEDIKYKMLCYRDEKGEIFYLNAQKNYVSLYVGNIKKVDPKGNFLEGLDCGKGCIRFKKSVSVSDTRIDDFLKKSIEMWKNGVDIGCDN